LARTLERSTRWEQNLFLHGVVDPSCRPAAAQHVSVEPHHVTGAINLPLKELTRAEAERRLRRDRPVIVYCNDQL
jgi:rhodanese-related sulfurtransferase